MKKIKNIVWTNLSWLGSVVISLIILVSIFFQMLVTHRLTADDAEIIFTQIGQIMEENNVELELLKESYSETCLDNADTIAYIVERNPGILGNVDEFKALAEMVQVNEIHIFNADGYIFTGTHPEYYNYSVYDGGQIGFFKQMLDDKNARLCQDITPNTAEGKLVQYSAVWSSDGQYIIQVGMYPDAVLALTKKNELSYIFSLLQGDPDAELYAIDPVTKTVVGSTVEENNGKTMLELGFNTDGIEQYRNGTHVSVSGVRSFCLMTEMNGIWLAYTISSRALYYHILSYWIMLMVALVAVTVLFACVMRKIIDVHIIRSISNINGKLRAVSEGNLDERVYEESSMEFAELSTHINTMIHSLLATTDKMSFVLNRTNMHIGVYEYNTRMKTVRFTDHIQIIFDLSEAELTALTTDSRQLESFIEMLRREPMPGLENTYRYVGENEKYIKLEEVIKDNDVLGIVMDVTEETLNLRRAEAERDIDLLTGIYNRRGMEGRFEKLFSETEDIKHGALIIIDLDDLKYINDNYGHRVGDIYLKAIADMLNSFDAPEHFAARFGGDEFVLLIYGYEDDAAIYDAIVRIRYLQDNATKTLEDGTVINIRFSFGYELTHGRQDYNAIIAVADGRMYDTKRERKAHMANIQGE